MKGSSLLRFLLGYERSEKSFSASKLARIERKFTEKVISGIGTNHAKKLIRNPVIRFFSGLSRMLAYTSLRAFGGLLLTFSLMTLLLNLFSYYIFESMTAIPLIALVTSAVCGVISIPLLLVDTPAIEAIQHIKPLDNLLFEVLCLKRTSARRGDVRPAHPLAMIFLGILLSALGFLAPLWLVLLIILGIVYLFMAIASPEFSFMMTLLSLPFIQLIPHTSIVLAAATVISALSFAFKVMLGKRNFHFEQYDALIILFLLFVFVSGIFGGLASFTEALLLTALTLAYPLASNLIANRRLADNASNLILASSVPTAIYAIVTYFAAPAHPEWMDPAFAGSIASRATATFGNPNIYAVFLIVAIVFSFVFIFDKVSPAARAVYIFVFLLNLTAMILTWTRGAWVALILSLLAAFVLGHIKFKILLVPLALIPLAATVFGSSLLDRLLSIFNLGDTSVSSRLSIWRSSLSMFSDNLWTGIGIGTDSFTEHFLIYAEDGVTAPHSHNLFLEIGVEAGIFALILFVLLLLARVRHIATYSPYIKRSSIAPVCTAASIALFGLVTFGMTDYIFYNSSMYFLFFAIFGIASASLRISRQEYADAHLNLGSESSADSAEADISILR